MISGRVAVPAQLVLDQLGLLQQPFGAFFPLRVLLLPRFRRLALGGHRLLLAFLQQFLYGVEIKEVPRIGQPLRVMDHIGGVGQDDGRRGVAAERVFGDQHAVALVEIAAAQRGQQRDVGQAVFVPGARQRRWRVDGDHDQLQVRPAVQKAPGFTQQQQTGVLVLVHRQQGDDQFGRVGEALQRGVVFLVVHQHEAGQIVSLAREIADDGQHFVAILYPKVFHFSSSSNFYRGRANGEIKNFVLNKTKKPASQRVGYVLRGGRLSESEAPVPAWSRAWSWAEPGARFLPAPGASVRRPAPFPTWRSPRWRRRCRSDW
ncbi:Uncharacterised protein [Chromobacterium violaceum]|uniref:Uncharacterized protein n=1 Tax=Chromobacterium violaceum TaxID=536 RepID=A0A3S4IAY9_CHRVL|nr:Uncharacterised protein [Chromobacterium violaceum]